MKEKATDPLVGQSVDDAQDALVDSDLFDTVFGEPSDEEIAAVLQQAKADFDAGLYQPSNDQSETPSEEDEPWRPRTKQEILEGIALGYKQALAGESRPVQELFKELKDL